MTHSDVERAQRERKDTVLVSRPDAADITCSIFEAYGASASNARLVADHLVESEGMGLPSHGLIRVSQYVAEARSGQLDPSAVPTVQAPTAGPAVIDGHWTYGQVAGMRASELVSAQTSEHGMGFTAVRRVQHTGRLGAYVEPLARAGFLALAFAAGAPRFHRVAPFGAREGRMSTNPIAWAIPTQGDPLTADFSTSTMPEGRIRVLVEAGQSVPPDVICDYEGKPTTDPAALYGSDPWPAPGFLLPLGGPRFGHKGYALGLMVECFATIMAGDDADDDVHRGNNLAILAVRGDAGLGERAAGLVAYMKSARPIVPERPVMVPGELERSRAEGSPWLAVASTTWQTMVALAAPMSITVPAIASAGR